MSKFNTKTFFQKLRFRYKVSILNENTLGEVWFAHLTRLKVFLLLFLVFIIFFVITTLVLFKTPLKKFTPGYLDSELQTELVNKSMELNALLGELDKQKEYISAIKSLMIGEIKIDTVVPIDTLLKYDKTFIEKSEKEKEFCETFENEEKYNLSVLETPKNKDLIVFCAPVNGLVVEKFQLKQHYGVDITAYPNENVVAVLDGTVIMAEFTTGEGYVIQIQHPNNLISIYKNNSTLLKKVGDKVKSGESIAIVGTNAKDNTGHLHFELWQEGVPLNPETYITF